MEEQANRPDPGFGVEIRSGRRAVATDAPKREPQPERKAPAGPAVARKDRNRNLALLGVALAALFIAGLVGWQAWSTRVPPGVLARVNGEEITVERIELEINVARMLGALVSGQEPQPETLTRSALLTPLIQRRMQAQDANRAGLVITDEDMDLEVKSTLLDRNALTEDDLTQALAGYGLTRGDLYTVMRDYPLINRYIAEYVTKGATSGDERSRLHNDWLAQLQRTSRIEIFAASDVPVVGSIAPEFKLPLLKPADAPAPELGATPVAGVDYVSLEGLRGRPVIINFWATWCQPCRVEIPELQAAYAMHQSSAAGPATPGLQVLGVLVQSDPNIALSFQKEFGITFPILIDNGSQVKDQYRVVPIPSSFFIDRQGVIQFVKVGMLTEREIQEQLKKIQ